MPLPVPDSDVSLDSAPGELPLHSSTLQQPPLLLSLSLGRSPDSHARDKSLHAHKSATVAARAASMASALHCTAPHSTAPHGRQRLEMHLCTLSVHFLARIARVLFLRAAMCGVC